MNSINIKPKFEELKSSIRKLEEFKKIINAKRKYKIWKLHFPRFSEFEFFQVIKNLNNIQEIIERPNVKCVFIGRTSNGKSAVINSILGKSLLPSDMGSITSCYINIQGCDKDIEYLLVNGEKLNIEQLDKTNKDVDNCYSNKDTLQLHFPKSKCDLLTNNIELIDTPGLDTEETDDVSTDKCCEDAELFILVLDCNSGLSVTEKAKMKSKISKKNIIILMNKWDITDQYDSEKKNKIKKKLDDMASSFLTSDLEIQIANGEIKPIFFVSAIKALDKKDKPFEDFQRYLLDKTSNLLKSKVRNSIKLIEENVRPALILMDNSPTKNLKEMSEKEIDNWISEHFSNFKTDLKKICTEKAKEVVGKLMGKKKEILEVNFRRKSLEKKIVEELSSYAREELRKMFSTLVTNVTEEIKNKLIFQCGTKVSPSDMDVYFSGSNDLDWARKEFKEKVEEKIKAIKSDVKNDMEPSAFCLSCFGIIVGAKSLTEIIGVAEKKFDGIYKKHFQEILQPIKTRMEQRLYDSVEMFNKDVREIKKMASMIEKQRNQCLQLVEDIKKFFNV